MTVKITAPARQARAGVLEVSAAKTKKSGDRTVTLTFSSEAPVSRHYFFENGTDFVGLEVLGHDESEVDFTRLASGRAALLTDHSQTIDSQVGVVEKVWIEAGRGRAVVRFGKGARASEIHDRVLDGEITGVSVGYEITSLAQTGEVDGVPVIRAHWSPYEITLCPVPADPTVGIGRAAQGDDEIQITINQFRKKEETPMAKEIAPTPATPKPAGPTRAELMVGERTRTREIRALGAKFEMPQDKIDAALDGDTSVDNFQRSILDNLGSNQAEATRAKDAEIGMTDKEVRNYSLMAAVRYLANPTDKRAIENAKFEIEISQSAEGILGRSARGLLVPSDVLSAQNFIRSQSVGTPTKGGNLVATQHMDSSFIGLLRKRAALTRLGVRTLTGLVGNVEIPRQTGGATAYWIGEGAGPTESDLSVDNLSLTPHTLAGAVAISRRAQIQTSPDIEALVRDDLIQCLALEIDRVGINGDADGDAPDGLLDAAINDVDFAATGAPTWAEIVAMESEISSDDADVEGMKYLFNANMRGHFKSTPKVGGTAEFMMMGKELNGYGTVTSNNSPAKAYPL
ncbi:MAG: HK97 family phage major capsid protein [Granulosicoccus sp.]|jgi:HK97 family phage major capsid protein